MTTINAIQLHDFSYEIDYKPLNTKLIIRELCVKDLYVREDIEKNSFEFYYMLLTKCCLNYNLDEVPLTIVRPLLHWFIATLYSDLDLNNWYKTAYFLLRGRWSGADLDWLENQPLSKLLKMIEVMNAYSSKFM